MSPQSTTRSPAVYQLLPLILAINPLGIVLAAARPRSGLAARTAVTSRAIPRLRQIMAASGYLVTGPVTSLVPEFCIADPAFRSLLPAGERHADTAAPPPGPRQWFTGLMTHAVNARSEQSSPSSGFPAGQKFSLPGRRLARMAVLAGG